MKRSRKLPVHYHHQSSAHELSFLGRSLLSIFTISLLASNQSYAEPIVSFDYLDLSINRISIGHDFRSHKSSTKRYDINTLSHNTTISHHIKTMQFGPEINAAMILEYEQSTTDMLLHQTWINQHHYQQKSREGSKALNYLMKKAVLRWWMKRDNSDSIDLKLLKVDREGNMGNNYRTGLRYNVSLGTGSNLSFDKVDFNIEYEF
ncbi:hypothetical protein EDC56_0778 [Sinobacterium caligoides]|uniref:Uncharacterized protein n=1 Tax=Sinobacterium caligoides TaxID=933926 RepID=A0A3N2DZJ1_9GAMM|nr:hypothetical protein [Sinobacterium caligoides]ROS05248.1 hypothetical protein EDC56_0778 [Sinobacterium caligoides]